MNFAILELHARLKIGDEIVSIKYRVSNNVFKKSVIKYWLSNMGTVEGMLKQLDKQADRVAEGI